MRQIKSIFIYMSSFTINIVFIICRFHYHHCITLLYLLKIKRLVDSRKRGKERYSGSISGYQVLHCASYMNLSFNDSQEVRGTLAPRTLLLGNQTLSIEKWMNHLLKDIFFYIMFYSLSVFSLIPVGPVWDNAASSVRLLLLTGCMSLTLHTHPTNVRKGQCSDINKNV